MSDTNSDPEVVVWCIRQVFGDDKLHSFDEVWVHVASNPDFKFPRHGAKAQTYHGVDLFWHLTPFAQLDRKRHLKRGRPIKAERGS